MEPGQQWLSYIDYRPSIRFTGEVFDKAALVDRSRLELVKAIDRRNKERLGGNRLLLPEDPRATVETVADIVILDAGTATIITSPPHDKLRRQRKQRQW